jgi:uncharacterized protein
MSNPNRVAWFEIYVQDMARARRFYESVFQLSLQRLDNPELEMWAFPQDFGQYGCGGALVHMPGFPSGGNSCLVYFSCQDCAVEESRVVAAGGRIQRPKTSIGAYGAISLVIDTEGNMLGLHNMAG